jgi:TolB protein
MQKRIGLVALMALVVVLAACAGEMLAPTATAIPLVATATPSSPPTRAPTRTLPPTLTATPTAPDSSPATPSPGAALSALDDLLAQRTVEGFLSRLAGGDAGSAFRLLLTDEAKQGDAAQLAKLFTGSSPHLVDATLVEFRRATASSYEARAVLRWAESSGTLPGGQAPASQAMTLTVAYQRGLWLIDRITLAGLEPPAPTPTPRPAATNRRSAPQLDGRLVFQASSGGKIYLVNVDGSGLTALTDGLDPAWSPDGSTIALTRWRTPWGVYLVQPDGSREERVVDGIQLKEVAWSPDGSRIVFTVNFSSAEPMEICFFGFCFTLPPFSFGQMWTANLESGELLSLPLDDKAVHAPTWSPAGNRIVYAGDRGLAWIDLDTMEKDVLAGGSAWDTSPTFSPDGGQIAFMGRVHNHWEVFVMHADGSDRRQLTHGDPALDPPPSNVAPAWSPDGKHLIFLSNRDGPWRFYVMNADGAGQRSLFGASLDHLDIRYEWATERVVSWSR